MLVRVHPITPQPRFVEQALRVIEHDGVLVYPTESGYAVGCSAGSPKAMQKLYKLKAPVKSRFMALLFHDFSQIALYADVTNFAFRTMKHLVPGPYTFILPARYKTAKLLGVKRLEVGVRMPTHPFLRTLLPLHEHPFVSTAAKFSDREDEEFTEGEAIEDQYGRSVDAVVDSGSIAIDPTTVVSLLDDRVELVRQGQGSLEPFGL